MDIDYDDILRKCINNFLKPENTTSLKLFDHPEIIKRYKEIVEKDKIKSHLINTKLKRLMCGKWLDQKKDDFLIKLLVHRTYMKNSDKFKNTIQYKEIERYECKDCGHLAGYPGNNHHSHCKQFSLNNCCALCHQRTDMMKISAQHTDMIKISYTKCHEIIVCEKCLIDHMKMCEKCKFICDACGTIHAQHLTKCKRCLLARYCDRNCQIFSWRFGEHKTLCIKN